MDESARWVLRLAGVLSGLVAMYSLSQFVQNPATSRWFANFLVTLVSTPVLVVVASADYAQ